MRITWVGHATVLVELAGLRLLTDPLLRGRLGHLRRLAPAADRAATTQLDAVLISHAHHDHLDPRSLRRLGGRPRLIAPRGTTAALPRHGFAAVDEVAAGDTVALGAVTVRAVPARHDGRRWPFGRATDALGYVIEGGERVYFAGDTDVYDEMARLAPGLDVALLPIWGWGPSLGPGHMGPREAARALVLLKPRVAIPIHWGTFFPHGLHRLRGRALTDPPHAFAREAARAAPEVDVRILDPGGATRIATR